MKRTLSLALALIMLITTLCATGVNVFAASFYGWCGPSVQYKINFSNGVLDIYGSGYTWDCGWFGDEYYSAPWDDYDSVPYDPAQELDKIKTINITGDVDSLGDYLFAGLYNVSKVNIEAPIKYIGENTFFSLWNLTSINIPDTVEEIYSNAFYKCGLKNVSISKNVSYLVYDAFYGCENLQSINVDAANKKYCSVDGILYNKSKTVLMKIPSGKSISTYTMPSTVKTICNYAIVGSLLESEAYYNKLGLSLSKVVFSKNLETVGEYNFAYCKKLTSVTFPKGTKSIYSDVLEDCPNLTSVSVPGTVETIGVWFAAVCTNLTSVKIGYGVKTIKTGSFVGCKHLTKFTMPNTVTTVGSEVLKNCSSLKALVLSTKLTKIPTGFAFNCPKLKSVFIPSSVKSIASNSLGRRYNSDYDYATVSDFKLYSKGNSAAINYANKYKAITHVKVSVPKLAFKSVSAVSKGFKATWTKNTKMTGYQIQYATNSKFTSAKTVTVTDEKTSSKTIKNLTAKKKYYVRVRNYKRYAGAPVYSAWSSAKSVTTKA